MEKRIFSLIIIFTMVFSFVGCKKESTSKDTSSTTEETVVVEEIVVKGEDKVSSKNNVSSDTSKQEVSSTVSKQEVSSTVSSQPEKEPEKQPEKQPEKEPEKQPEKQPEKEPETPEEPEWKSHPEDFKLIAFTFDDGPSSNMSRYVQLFSGYEGAGTFFVNGSKIKDNSSYFAMQSAINAGWDIGNHGDNHLVATTGGALGEASYDEIKADIVNLKKKLESKLKTRDGAPYKVNFYRPPNIKPTANSFKVCREENLALIWLSHDALDWDATKTYNDRYNVFSRGINTWKDGDIILCHEIGVVGAEDTYKILEKLLPSFYKAGYRFCSISELMEMRGITIDQISGELNDVDGNRGMVTNILDAAKAGKK